MWGDSSVSSPSSVPLCCFMWPQGCQLGCVCGKVCVWSSAASLQFWNTGLVGVKGTGFLPSCPLLTAGRRNCLGLFVFSPLASLLKDSLSKVESKHVCLFNSFCSSLLPLTFKPRIRNLGLLVNNVACLLVMLVCGSFLYNYLQSVVPLWQAQSMGYIAM